jgi:MFS family permease
MMTSAADIGGRESMTAVPLTARDEIRVSTDRRSRLLQPTLILVGLIVAVLSSLGAPLIPSIAADSHVSLSTATWLLTITMLTGALSTPVLGKLSDGPHQKRVITFALVVVLVGSAMAALTSTFALLVVARGLQGLGLGLLPVTMAIARRHLPGPDAAKAIALLSVTAAVGVGLGYPVTGLLAEASDYHLAFWFGTFVVGLALVASLIVLPGKSPVATKPFDVMGSGLLILAVTALIVMLSEASDWGWTSLPTLGLLAIAFVMAAIWARHELRTAHPIVELRQARHRMVLTADLAGLLMSVAMYLYLPIIVEFIQVPRREGYGFGVSVVVAGCALIPLSVGTYLSSRLAVLYERRFGRRSVIPFGAMLFAASIVFFAVEHGHLWEAFVSTGLAGIGIGFTFAAMPGYIVRTVSASETGSAMGFYQVLRSIGLAIGSAVSAVVLAAYTTSGSLLPTVGGFRMALLIGAMLCGITAVMSWILPGAAPAAVPASATEEAGEIEGSGLMMAQS